MRLLLIFLKEPIPGKVKTSLTEGKDPDSSSVYYQAMLGALLRQLQGLNHTRIRFCYTPDDASDAVKFLLLPPMNASPSPDRSHFIAPNTPQELAKSQEIDFAPQGSGEINNRLNRAFAQGFTEGFHPIIAMRSDCPDCGARWLNACFARLESRDNLQGIIGPCNDGSAYLLALKSPQPELLLNIENNKNNLLSNIINTADSLNLPFDQLPPLPCVTQKEDWLNLLASPLGAGIKKDLSKKNNFIPDYTNE